MCDPGTAAIIGGGAMLGGSLLSGQAQGRAYANAANANAQALAHQQAYQNQINKSINNYLNGLNIAQGLSSARARENAAIAGAMNQARPVGGPVTGGNYRQRLAADNANKAHKIAAALASMEGWRAYNTGEGINRARLAQRIGTLASFAGGQRAVDSLATKAASIPDQNAMFAGQLLRDIGGAAFKFGGFGG